MRHERWALGWALASMGALGCDDGRGGTSSGTSSTSGSSTVTSTTEPAGSADDTGTAGSGSATAAPEPPGLGEHCDDEQQDCAPGLHCLFEQCTWACGDGVNCCPEGMLCGGIEYECRPPAEDWCGDPCDGQAWHACREGEACVLAEDGVGSCVGDGSTS